ncbi:hypothetical protein SLEP1_g54855 [Rubroshorea leprosula]|uniref:DUF4219 domain-containing protein n=1 Tax=Rubroshorea leprosula TaxID=152421 RepID=A0AAV5MET0_9ROSI|nr:hypothetical protein SLEP1_g54855 [Rubroshorea leprosula]
MEMVTSPSTIVPEALKKDNYERWSILMQHYLELQDLWEVIQSDRMPQGGNRKEWSKKNALALYAIRISCGTEAFDQIKKISHAKTAWDALADKLKPRPIVEVVNHDISELHQERQTEHEVTLQNLVCYESISNVKQFLHSEQDKISPQMLDSALKHAITCGRKNMAHYLYKKIPLDHFLREDSGFFLLQHCITKRTFDIALDLLHHFSDLVSKHPSNCDPIILTLAQTAPPFLSINELGSWGRWIYKSTRVKAFPIKPRSAPVGGVGIVQDHKLRKWIFRMEGLGMLVEVFFLFIVPLLKLDLLCVLIGVPLLRFLLPPEKPGLSLILFPVFILLLGKQ